MAELIKLAGPPTNPPAMAITIAFITTLPGSTENKNKIINTHKYIHILG